MAEADKDKKEQEGEEKEGKKVRKGSPLKWILIIAVGVLLLAGGGVFAWLKFLSPQAKEVSVPQASAKEEEVKPTDEMGAVVPLDTFIVNLADKPESKYLKITVQLEFEKPELSEELKQKLPRVRDALLILLSSKDYESIRTVEGKLQLRDEILNRVNMVLQTGKAKMAYFTDFVVQ